MTVITRQIGRWMINTGLTSSHNAIMARFANTKHLIMVDMRNRFKGGSIMAGFANFAGVDMGRRLTSAKTTIMAIHAYRAGAQLAVIHLLLRHKGLSIMASTT